ncbi:MAG: DUF1343 domain-containing protein [Bacteroidetes bacterium]|nr:DUF1343 domain-containing protein [Bacteroidota bacterium]
MITAAELKVGAERTDMYLPWLINKKVAVVANHTARVGKKHLVDTLIRLKVDIVRIFSPEHGFRGSAEPGEALQNYKDKITGLPVISLYGDKEKPSKEDMTGIDLVIFDIQDVGVRFYTYATTMQYMMEACAQYNIPFILLDRPNPNGYYVEGPVLEKKQASFVGLNPVPLVHGLTLGEYATMINGEGWLRKGLHCDLKVVPVWNYNHTYLYQLKEPPSPNLPNMASVILYPSLGLFEGTIVSVGRGTSKPFQVIGYPGLKGGNTTFTPVSMPGFSTNPPYKDMLCQGYDLEDFSESFIRDSGKLYLYWILELYKTYPEKKKFFNSFFDKLAGTTTLRKQIQQGMTEEAIRSSWANDLSVYKKMRKKYLLYPDFE